jgi:integrase/recombinase XerD
MKLLRKHDWQNYLARLEGAYAEGTLRAYRSDIYGFITWCELKKRRPFPATARLVADFVTEDAKRCSAATIKRRLAAISKIHLLMKLANPISDEEVKLALRRELRKKPARPKQALGLTRKLRDQLIDACDNTLIGKRDKAIIAVGYDTLSRRSELISLKVEDLIVSGNSVKLIIRRSKNDQLGLGRIAHISSKTFELLRDWLYVANITEGPIFCAIKHGNVSYTSLHPHSIGLIVKKAAKAANLSIVEIENLSGHSMRIGAAQDMMTSGLDILPIMAAGGWKTTNVVARYIENADISPLLHTFYE